MSIVRVGALLLAARLLFLLAGLDPEEERALLVLDPATVGWSRGPERPLYDVEELYCGTAGQAIRMGSDAPLHLFQYTSYGGGSLLLALLSIPLYDWFGPYYLTFKAIALAVSVAGGLLWWSVVRAWLGERAATLFALLYALAPPVLVRTALIAKGDHPEAMAWIGLVLVLATRAVLASGERRRRAWAAATGALLGVGTYVTYSVLPVLAGMTLVALIRTRARPRGAWLAAGAGLLVGLAPWIASFALTEGRALQLYGPLLSPHVAGADALGRAALLLRRGFGASYDFPAFAAQVSGFVWFAAVAVGTGRLVLARATPAAPFVLAGLVVHLAAWCLVAPAPGSRYLVPAYPLLLIAALWPALAAKEGGRPLRLALPAAVMLLGALSQAGVVARSSFVALRAPLAGTFWPLLGEVLGPKLTVEQIRSFPDPAQRHLWFGVGVKLGGALDDSRWERRARQAGPFAADCLAGAGFAWGARGNAGDAGRDLAARPPAVRESLLRGLECFAETPFVRPFADSRAYVGRLLASLDGAERARVARPIARSLAVLATQDALPRAPELRGAELDLLDESERQRGAGWSLFRGIDRRSRVARWTPPAGAWTDAAAHGDLATAPLAFVEGLADAYEWRLSRLAPRFLLGDARDAGRLGRELALLTDGLDAPRAACFHRAAGRAAARALADEGVAPAQLRWHESLAPAHHEAFREGLESGASLRVPGPSL